MELLLTGYGVFGEFDLNPSAWLAENIGLPHRVLPVTFADVDQFIEEIAHDPPGILLMLGLHGKAERFHIELVARNTIGETPDVAEIQRGPGPIHPSDHAQYGTTLWQNPAFYRDSADWQTSTDAGTYLCNYVYYQALRKLPTTRCGFLHVPRPEVMPLNKQLNALREIIANLTPVAAGA